MTDGLKIMRRDLCMCELCILSGATYILNIFCCMADFLVSGLFCMAMPSYCLVHSMCRLLPKTFEHKK